MSYHPAVTAETYSADELETIRALQRLTYDCAEQVAAGLDPGASERDAAARLGEALRDRGAQGFFHTPFAWFGDRAGFYDVPRPSWRRPLEAVAFAREFFPTDRRLGEGGCGILDVAPIKDGVCADIGYSFSIGESPRLDRAMDDLGEVRDLILETVRAGSTMRELYRTVDAALAEMGYESAHRAYPSQVLAHKVGRIPLASLPSTTIRGFDPRALLYLGRQLVAALPGLGRLPLINEGPLSDRPLDPGLWAFEPHVRVDGLGAKWEELMVVTGSDAYWLDDDLPHVRRRRRP